MEEFDYSFVENIIGYNFKNKELLYKSFVHPSYSGDANVNYEKLEFLGDSILNLIISEKLYNEPSIIDEGELTKIKSYIVSKEPLANYIKSNDLHNLIITHKEINKNEIINQIKIQSNIYESILGAIYLDSRQYEVCKSFVLKSLNNAIESAIAHKSNYIDYKSMLYEYCQKNRMDLKFNCVSDSFDQSTNSHIFEINCVINNEIIDSIKSSSKKEGEKILSYNVINKLKF